MFEKELKCYIQSFDKDKEEIEKDLIFAKDAIQFIMKENLYVKFTQFQVEKRQEEYEKALYNKKNFGQ